MGINAISSSDIFYTPFGYPGIVRAQNSQTDKQNVQPGDNPTTAVYKPEKDKQPEDDPKIRQEIQRLKAIEEKVKAHEQAHKSAGGQFTGPVNYQYTVGPDGKRYIIGGEVPISIQEGKTPDETIRNMEIVKRAALAPADPSPQDRAVAAEADAISAKARMEKLKESAENQKNPEADKLTNNAQGENKTKEPFSDKTATTVDKPQSNTTDNNDNAKNKHALEAYTKNSPENHHPKNSLIHKVNRIINIIV